MNKSLEECPVKFLSLHTKLKQCVEAGIVEENEVCHPGIGKGKYLTYKGNKVAIKKRVKGKPTFDNILGETLYFREPHDVAYCPVENKIICYALSL